MAISVDWNTKIVSVPRADMQIVQSTPSEIRSLDLDLFWRDIKDLEDGEGMPYVDIQSRNAAVSVGGVTLAPVVQIINGFSVTFEDGPYAVNLVGANSNVGDVVNVNQVSVRSANSAGLTFSEQINSQSFIDAAVYLDVSHGLSGTAFPRGTPTDPVDNLTDALAIVAARSLQKIYLTGFVIADGSHDLSGITVVGGSGASNVLLLSGANTANSGFERLIVAGAQNGLARIVDCILGATGLGNFTNCEGRIKDSIINNVAGISQNPTGAGTLFDNCEFVAPDSPQITLDANGKAFGLNKCSGTIIIKNYTDAELLTLNLAGATVEVAASCTSGGMHIEGYGSVSDNSDAGCSVDILDLLDAARLRDLWRLQGLDSDEPMTVTPTSRSVGNITQTITGDGETTSTVTRQ